MDEIEKFLSTSQRFRISYHHSKRWYRERRVWFIYVEFSRGFKTKNAAIAWIEDLFLNPIVKVPKKYESLT